MQPALSRRTVEFRRSMLISTIERNEVHETLFVSCLMTPHNCPKPAQSNVAVGGSAPSVLGGKIISHNQSAETSDAEIQWRWLLACVTTNPPISHIGGLTAHHDLSTICKVLRLSPSSSPHAKAPFSLDLAPLRSWCLLPAVTVNVMTIPSKIWISVACAQRVEVPYPNPSFFILLPPPIPFSFCLNRVFGVEQVAMTGGGEGGRGGERAILKRLRRESEWDAEYETWNRKECMQRQWVESAYFDLRKV